MARGEVKVYYPRGWAYPMIVFMIAFGGYLIFAGVEIFREAVSISDQIPAILVFLFGAFCVVFCLWLMWQLVQKNRWIEVHEDRLEAQQPMLFYLKRFSWKWDEIATLDIFGKAGIMATHKPPIKKRIGLKGYPRELLFEIVRRTPGIKIHLDVYKKIRKLADEAGYPFTEESFL